MSLPEYLKYESGALTFDGVRLDEAAADFGTPLFLYSRSALEDRYRAFERGLGERKHMICYAVKASSNLGLLRIVAGLGGGADIVSGGELFRALRAGIPANRILFAGVGKTATEMAEALEADIHMFVVESESELRLLSDVAVRTGRDARVSLRVNPDVDPKTHPYISTGLERNKFGIPHDQVVRLFELALQLPRIDPAGLGAHIGSQLTDLAPFQDSADRLNELAAKVRSAGVNLRYVDVGGGLGIRYSDEEPPTPEQYGQAITQAIDVPDTTLVCEPGRSLIGNAGIFVSRVLVRKSNRAHNFLICDGAMNDMIRPALYQAHHTVLAVSEADAARTVTGDLVGPVCESGDFLARDRQLPDVPEGGLVVLTGAGAYSFSMASNYNSRGRAAEVIVHRGQSTLARTRESYEDQVRNET